MSECKKCGREGGGHWIGCAEVLGVEKKYDWNGGQEPNPLGAAVKELLGCEFDGCTEPRKSADKRVKFCEFHSIPKNRK
ncbi:MAG: hypothetical protein ACTHON_15085 [Humibacter sp.]